MYEMDEEIRQLRSRLVSQEEDQQTMRDLRAELTVLMEKAVRGERTCWVFSVSLKMDCDCL